MNRRQLAFIVLVNALISLTIALFVAWVIEMRRPDPEELAVRYTPGPGVILAATAAPGGVATLPTPAASAPQILPTASSGESVNAGEPGAQQIYVVEAGDSLGSIATRFGVTLDELIQANNLANPDFLFSGQRLAIPSGSEASADGGAASTAGGLTVLDVENSGTLSSEAVQIGNNSDSPVTLVGWRLERENGPAYEFGNVTLFPGSGVRVYTASGEDDSQRLYWGLSESVWPTGAVVRLVNAQGALVDSFTVTDSP